MYFELSNQEKYLSLQWFPFTRINALESKYMQSEDFFYTYIDNASFVMFPELMHRSKNYLQKGDGSFRDSSLLSPILYLLIQAIGREISKHNQLVEDENIHVFYAGNYEENKPNYRSSYDEYFKLINVEKSRYQYFIRTDIENFFSNINLDILIALIDRQCNKDKMHFKPFNLKMIKGLLQYCGDGRFPTIEHSIASSYLATMIYMNDIDKRLVHFITDKIDCIKSFRIIRYVDDMYILIESDSEEVVVQDAYNQIRNEYSSILREYDLFLNYRKCCFKTTDKINEELKRSQYDEYVNGIKSNLEDLFSENFTCFLEALLDEADLGCLDNEKYNELIVQYFSSEDVELTPEETLRYFIYGSKEILKEKETVSLIQRLIEKDISFISLDPKLLTTMIVKTRSEVPIKALLNRLFERNKKGLWNSYDTATAISYLIQRNFQHKDLIYVLYQNSGELHEYYNHFCKSSFGSLFYQKSVNQYLEIIDDDWKAYFLYFMYWVEKHRNNSLAEYAFFKNFFDRFTADLSFFSGENVKDKKPNYRNFYKEAKLKSFYKDIQGSEEIINKAHLLRNSNPLSHASSDYIDDSSNSMDMKNSIKDLSNLLDKYVRTLNINGPSN